MKRSVAAMNKVGGVGVPTIKPWNVEAVMEKLDILNANNIFAAAMDIDGAGLPFLKAMNPNAGSKTVSELHEIINYAKMPFILKGIMTAKAAEKAKRAAEYAKKAEAAAAPAEEPAAEAVAEETAEVAE